MKHWIDELADWMRDRLVGNAALCLTLVWLVILSMLWVFR